MSELENDKQLQRAINRREFDEYPACQVCGCEDAEEFLTTRDNCTLRKCSNCTHIYTSPRFDEKRWNRFLKLPDNDRNKEYTDNRLEFGRALARRQDSSKDDWREKIRTKNQSVLRKLSSIYNEPPKTLHDVGCGVGFFLMDARDEGIKVSGNDLNHYACYRMRTDFGLDVQTNTFANMQMAEETISTVTMVDYIEHAYTPGIDVAEAFRVLEPGGLLYVDTFRIDSPGYENNGNQWNMLCWNHVQHFSTKTLNDLIERNGFEIIKTITPEDRSWIKIVAKKPGRYKKRTV